MSKKESKRTVEAADLDKYGRVEDVEKHIRIKDASELTGLSSAYFRALVMRRKIRHVKVGTATLIPLSEIRRLIADGRREPVGAA